MSVLSATSERISYSLFIYIYIFIYSFYVSKSNRFLNLIEYEDGPLLKHAENSNLA